MLNEISEQSLTQQLARLSQVMDKVELFFKGQPISTARIADAAIDTAQIADLSVVNAKFADLAITNAEITSVDATQFTAGTLAAARIAAASITADKLDVSTLSAISADVGTITAGTVSGNTVTGANIRTATSGARTEMTASPNALRILNSSGDERVRFDPDGLKLSELGLNFIRGGNFRGGLFSNTSPNQILFEAGNVDELFIVNATSGGDIQFVAADYPIYMTAPDGISINGSPKTAIVPTSEGYNALYTLESPEVWFFDFAPTEAELDPMFDAVTEGERNILKTDQGEVLVFAKRRGHGKTRFGERTLQQFKNNNKFWGGA